LKFRDRTLIRFADADRIVMERGPRKVTFAKVDGTWRMTAPLSAEAEAAALDELLNAVARLRPDELITDKPADLKPFGLDSPELRAQFFAAEKEVAQVLIAKREDDGRRFGKLASGELIAKLDPVLSDRLTGEYRKRTLWANLDAAQVETLVISEGSNVL